MTIDMATVDITPIVKVVISLCFMVVTVYIIPWIKSKTSLKQQEIIYSIATTAVYAAQQLYDATDMETKKDYAMARVESELKRYGITLSTDEISTYIEGALKDIKTSITTGKNW